MNNVLYRKYRPRKWEDVIGQRAAVKSLKNLLDDGRAQTFLLHGPSGVGKTTLARIATRHLGCHNAGLIEIPAAVFTGVESMRELQDLTQYKPFGQSKVRAVILDESQRLSAHAWDSLLKTCEEPPEHVYWFFCTTNPAKIPDTIKTRAASIALRALNPEDLRRLVDHIITIERFKVTDGVVDLIIREAHGSPRQALVNLSACANITDRKEAATLLRTVLDSDPVLELCRFLVTKGSWVKGMAIVQKLKDENPEGVRIIVANYMSAVAMNAKTDKAACAILSTLDAFSAPFDGADANAQLITAIGRAIFSGE